MTTPPQPRAPRSRSLGPVGPLAARRMWRDRWLVTASVVVVGLASFLAYAGPQLVLGTLDAGAKDALEAGNAPASFDLVFPVGNPGGNNVDAVRGLNVASVDTAATTMTENLPQATASIVAESQFWAKTDPLAIIGLIDATERDAAEEEGREPEPRARTDASVTFGFILGLDAVIVEGRLPEITADQLAPGENMPAAAPLEIALTAPVAASLDATVGTELLIAGRRGDTIAVMVVGIVDLSANEAILSEHLPDALEPVANPAGATKDRTRVSVILGADAAAAFTARTESTLSGTLRFLVDPDELTLNLARTVPPELDDLTTRTEDLLPDAGISPRLDAPLIAALEDYPTKARAALAQMSVLIAGVVAAAAGVIALMARLVVSARRNDIALERARGASVSTTAVTLLIEHAIVTAAGVALGFGAALLFAPGANPLDPLVGFIATVSLLAAPAIGGFAAREMWRGRRAPANRADRARLERAVKAKAITRDVLVVGVGALAVMSLRDRSVLSSGADGIDLFLSVGPVLVSLAAAVFVLRVYPLPMRAVQGIARRTRRIGGLLTLARARERVAALPLITLALALAVAAFGALLSTTVVVGQENASWQRTGAEIRLGQALSPDEVTALTDKGLTVSTVLHAPATTIALGSNLDPATVIAVDSSYADVVEAAGLPGAEELRTLETRADAWSPGEPLPAIASPSIADMDVYGRSDLFLGRNYLPIAIEAGTMSAADGWATGPYVIVPLDALLSLETQEPIAANRTFVSGIGADDAVTSLGLPDEVVISRQAWLDASRDSALIGGVHQVMVLAVGAVAALAALGLLVSVIDGSRRRSRALALLRTQGVGARYGWLLAAADLVPLILGAALAGAAGAALVVWLLTDTLGLNVLTGEITAPVLAVDGLHLAFGGAGLAALALGAMLAEVVAQRRSKLSEVLRYGETR